MHVLMVYPQFPDTFWSFKHALKFVNRKNNNPPLGLMTISSLLPEKWEKRLVDMNINPLKDSDIRWADMVFISAMDVQRASVHDVISRVKPFDRRIIAGGPLFTGEYDQFPMVDTFILNEGEITFPHFLADLNSDANVKRVYETKEFADMKTSPLPDLSLINMRQYECMSLQVSRGCPFHCEFCNVTALLGHIPRTKSVAQIIAELDQLYNAGWRHNVFIVDDNFIGNKKFLKEELLPAMIKWHQGKSGFNFITEASINLADDPDLMRLMTRAGFVDVFIGIETPNESSLFECNKKQNSNRDLINSINSIQNHGMQVMAGFIVGFDNDPPDIFERMISFIQESGIVTAMVGLLQAPFGTKLYERMENEGRILQEMSGDNSDGTTNIKTKMLPAKLKQGYFKIMKTIYSPEMLYPRIKTFLEQFNPKKVTVNVRLNEITAFIKSLFVMGFNPRESRHYWDLVWWTLRRDFRKFPTAITMVIYGYHFRTITERNLESLSDA
ncbi:MAG TPA: B12-binding domain-containing radical SAM protein [Anaerolineaceae bacterium]|nr:B12-binding domain-containing radical SAM protein [Anaerolineaceae bacterium]